MCRTNASNSPAVLTGSSGFLAGPASPRTKAEAPANGSTVSTDRLAGLGNRRPSVWMPRRSATRAAALITASKRTAFVLPPIGVGVTNQIDCRSRHSLVRQLPVTVNRERYERAHGFLNFDPTGAGALVHTTGRRFFLKEFLSAIFPLRKMKRSHPCTLTPVPLVRVPVKVHSETPRSP